MIVSQLSREIEFSSLPENINLIEVLVEDLKAEMSLTEEMEANILVTLSEAVNNAIYHGNKADPSRKVHVKILKNENILSFTIEDEGNGFDLSLIKDPTAPENLDKPTGRGVFLMQNLADKVEFFDKGKKVQVSFFLN